MNYQSIQDLNVSDALRHLSDAERMNDPEKIQIARSHLQNQLNLVKDTNPDLYQKYSKQFE